MRFLKPTPQVQAKRLFQRSIFEFNRAVQQVRRAEQDKSPAGFGLPDRLIDSCRQETIFLIPSPLCLLLLCQTFFPSPLLCCLLGRSFVLRFLSLFFRQSCLLKGV